VSPADILKPLHTALTPWVAEKKGVLSIAKDPYHVLELLAESPVGHRVILAFAGDTGMGDQPQIPLAKATIEVVLSYNLGLTAKPDEALITARGDRPSLLALVHDVRMRVLGIRFPDEITDVHIAYGGCEPVVTPDGVPLAAYRMQFSLGYALGDVTYTT
jgi:hypothetical protein